jgi:putative addiction module killer protein
MESKQRKVLIYQNLLDKEPYTIWIKSLKNVETRARIRNRIRRLELGNFGDHRYLAGNMLELKIKLGPGYRVYLGEKGDSFVILLLGGDKKSQSNDIKIAKQYWKEYLSRKEEF